MNWFTCQRQKWIADMLRIYGFINRIHLQRKFGISNIQAAHDFREFKKANPGAMRYNARKKIYIATEAPVVPVDKL